MSVMKNENADHQCLKRSKEERQDCKLLRSFSPIPPTGLENMCSNHFIKVAEYHASLHKHFSSSAIKCSVIQRSKAYLDFL
uniref:Uncharacterized protein n=1 Tax=Callorhinchus milii TaxID=7868 RepID=A0A4W3J080_CALMI